MSSDNINTNHWEFYIFPMYPILMFLKLNIMFCEKKLGHKINAMGHYRYAIKDEKG